MRHVPGILGRAALALATMGFAALCAADSVSFEVTQSPETIEMRHTGTAALFAPTLWLLDGNAHWRLLAPTDRYGEEWRAGERRRFLRSAFHGTGFPALVGQLRYREAGGWLEGHPFVLDMPERSLASIETMPFIHRLRMAPGREGLHETWLIATERRLPMPDASPLTEFPPAPPDPAVINWRRRAAGPASIAAPLAWDSRLGFLLHRDKDGRFFVQRVPPSVLDALNRPARLVVNWLFAIAAIVAGGALLVELMAKAASRAAAKPRCAGDVP